MDSNECWAKYIEKFKPQIRLMLQHHQIEGVSFLVRNIIDNGSGCILAHSMGLGKTLQIICFCSIALQENSKTKVLMLMPVNTIGHCEQEFENWMPVNERNFNVHFFKPSSSTWKLRLDIITKWSEDGGVLLLGYEMFRSMMCEKPDQRIKKLADKVQFLLFNTDILICDEGHNIKHCDTQLITCLQKIKTASKIILTGYPIQNNLLEYWCLINFVKPNFLRSQSEFGKIFATPILNGNYSDSNEEEVQLMLHRSYVLNSLLSPYVHRRCESVLQTTLPEKVDFVLLFRMTELQKQLYLKVLEHKHSPVKSFGIVCKIMNDPNVIFKYLCNKKVTDIEDIDDIDEINEGVYESLKHVMEGYVSELIVNSPKMIALFEIINALVDLGDRILVFSQSLMTLDIIEECLQSKLNWKKNLNYYRIDGRTTQHNRQHMINQFNQKDTVKLFMFSTKAGCMGTNLVGANRVIIFDCSFNPCNDLQAIGRVYRFGQKKKVFIYRFVMDHSLERSIYDHQVQKQQISNRILDKKNADPYMSLLQATSSYFKNEEQSNTTDVCKITHSYSDVVLQNMFTKSTILFTEQPLLHESFLIDQNQKELSRFESILAKIDFTLASCLVKAAPHTVEFEGKSDIIAIRESVPKLSIAPPTSLDADFTELLLNEATSASKQELNDKLCICLAGQISINTIFGYTIPPTIHNHIQIIAKIGYASIYHEISDKTNLFSDQHKNEIDIKVNSYKFDAFKNTETILIDNRKNLLTLAEALFENKTLSYKEIVDVIGPRYKANTPKDVLKSLIEDCAISTIEDILETIVEETSFNDGGHQSSLDNAELQ